MTWYLKNRNRRSLFTTFKHGLTQKNTLFFLLKFRKTKKM